MRTALERDSASRGGYTRDLRAAQQTGLLILTDLDTPGELAGSVLQVLAAGDLEDAIVSARRHVGQQAALDGLEHVLREATGVWKPWPGRWVGAWSEPGWTAWSTSMRRAALVGRSPC